MTRWRDFRPERRGFPAVAAHDWRNRSGFAARWRSDSQAPIGGGPRSVVTALGEVQLFLDVAKVHIAAPATADGRSAQACAPQANPKIASELLLKLLA